MNRKIEGVQKLWDRYKFAGLVVILGAVLLLLPDGGSPESSRKAAQPSPEARDLEAEMEDILGTMNGVGQVRVMLTADSGGKRCLALDQELQYTGSRGEPEEYSSRSAPILLEEAGQENPVVTEQLYPVYRGALVVCQGGGKASVKLKVTEAVAALTGLSAERITVAEWQ